MLCSVKLNWARWLSLCLILPVMNGCAIGLTDRAPVPASSYCAVAAPISYDTTKDTPETVVAIEAHNSKWVCICEGDCPLQTGKLPQK